MSVEQSGRAEEAAVVITAEELAAWLGEAKTISERHRGKPYLPDRLRDDMARMAVIADALIAAVRQRDAAVRDAVGPLREALQRAIDWEKMNAAAYEAKYGTTNDYIEVARAALAAAPGEPNG